MISKNLGSIKRVIKVVKNNCICIGPNLTLKVLESKNILFKTQVW
jgi:hypothetical protein